MTNESSPPLNVGSNDLLGASAEERGCDNCGKAATESKDAQ